MRIAVYGDVDLNLVDGSSVWLASLIETLSHGPNPIRLFLKTRPGRTVHLARIDGLPSVSWVHAGQGAAPATSAQALAAIEGEDQEDPFSAVILRGYRVARAAAQRPALRGRLWTYLTDVPQSPEAMDETMISGLEEIAQASRYLLCQTEDLRSFLESHVRGAARKTALLPPMIPPLPPLPNRESRDDGYRMIYAGKFAPLWATLEMVDVFRTVKARHPHFELDVYGDKIHRSVEQPGFETEMAAALTGTVGVRWHGAVPREEVLNAIPHTDVAWGWRRHELTESLELSTKLLEYGAAGVPAIVNRTPIHEQLLGPDYPLFASSLLEVEDLLVRAGEQPTLLSDAARGLRDRASKHSFEEVFRQHLAPLIVTRRSAPADSRTILIAGHDLKFVDGIARELQDRGHRILRDTWQNHSAHDPESSRLLLAQADVVLAEWCLGNAVWYSRQIGPDKPLVIRFHAQEIRTEYPAELRMEAVSRIIFVGPHLRDEAATSFGLPVDRLSVIPNGIDVVDLDRTKLPGAEFNLGLLGFCPASKGLSRALDLLEQVRASDDRYTLYLKGRMPWEYPWLWKRDEERDYFEDAFHRIRRSRLLRNAIVFDSQSPNIGAWFRKIGTILSVSEHESFHLSIAEGAASGATPLIVDWAGARRVYPSDWVVPDLAAAADRVIARIPVEDSKGYAHRSFSLRVVVDQLEPFLVPEAATVLASSRTG